jgi:osmotically-inducible protein OsmY
MNVLKVVTENQPTVRRRLTVTGWTDGTIWLRGQATTAECRAIKNLAREVEGVTQVFCYMASSREN